MLLTVSIFFFSIAAAFAIIAHKVWQFRAGHIVSGGYEEADWTDLSIESVRMRLTEIFKWTVHHFVLLALKIWMVTSNWVKRTDHSVKGKLTKVLHKNAHLPAGGKPSRFLKNIRDHKDEVVMAIHKEGDETTETE